MKAIGIKNACTEDWNTMDHNEKGAHCQKCAMQVHDFTGKSAHEIRDILYQLNGNRVCGRITEPQLDQLNSDFEAWQHSTRRHMERATLFAFIIVFGISMVSCTTEKDKESIREFQEKAVTVLTTDSNTNGQNELTDHQVVEQVIEPIKQDIIPEPIELAAPVDYEIIEKEVIIEDISVGKEKVMMLGGMAYTAVYASYLEEIIPADTIPDEYDESGRLIPKEFNISAYPNPTASISNIKFEVPVKTDAQILLFNSSGQQVRSIESSTYGRGTHELSLDLTDLETGLYFLIINSKEFSKTVKISKY